MKAKVVNRTSVPPYSSLQYFLDDYPHTLFPLSTTKVVIEQANEAIEEYVYQYVVNRDNEDHAFLSQTRCYSSKQGLHLRRTVKLDPVAEYFLYDIIYRNRLSFRKDVNPTRQTFGYRFEEGRPLSPTAEYARFRTAIATAKHHYKYSLKVDIASYFNSIYQHDLLIWFNDGKRSKDDVNSFGQFLREANTGRSIDCLPQGLQPCKLVGSEFLKFIDHSNRIRSEHILRFLDDIYIFSNDANTLSSDFITVQRLLGDKGLSVNSEKTIIGDVSELDISREVNDIKKSLLKIRRMVIEVSGEPIEVGRKVVKVKLKSDQVEYLLDLLKEPNIEEADAELILSLLRDRADSVLQHLPKFLEEYPSLSRKVYSFSKSVVDTSELASSLLSFIRTGTNVTEDQLFWLAKTAEDTLCKTPQYPDLLIALIEHPNATLISRAKVLEIPERRFGMSELREEHLRVGKSDWLAWASAVGTRNDPASGRNHVLGYFAKASPMNRIIADCIKSME